MGAACPAAVGAPATDGPRPWGLRRAELAARRAAGREVLECRRVLQKGGLNLVGEVLRGQGKFYENNHYPENDVYDAESHAQYYYHAHRGLAGEHGHFHTFLRHRGMPAQAAPLDMPHAEPRPSGDEALAHLIAISMDVYGEPIGLFAPNRWVAGDTWYAAGDVIAMLGRFRIDHAWPSWPLNCWLGAMFVLFRPHIEALLAERDRVVAAWRGSLAGEDVLERRDLEILAQLPVSVDETLAEVEKELS
ncbi:MAG: DUF6969 family protein [Betaproteobacteria bacterium]